jgi:hypothetical protein
MQACWAQPHLWCQAQADVVVVHDLQYLEEEVRLGTLVGIKHHDQLMCWDAAALVLPAGKGTSHGLECGTIH